MVVVRLIGGLGNQLFQYAVGRAVAQRCGAALGLDISPFEHYHLRNYRLHHLNIQAVIATSDTVDRITGRCLKGMRRKIFDLTQECLPYYRRAVFEEKHAHYDANIQKVADNVYLSGYWQSEKYFEDVEDVLREELTIKEPPDPVNQDMLRAIRNSESISLHVRRGDYVTDPKTNQHHGVCSLAYYHAAIDLLTQQVVRPHFFVFSDDIAWVQQHMEIDYPVQYVDHNGAERDYEDLRLMRHCKHHIIANSSFSWWGAWLANTPGKIVVAPRKWFNVTTRDTADLLPDSWITLD